MEMSYKEAIAEIEKILKSLREEQNSIDTLSERVARATELIALCREKLRKAEADVNSIIDNWQLKELYIAKTIYRFYH